MANYTLAQSFGKANVQDRLFYAQTETDKTAVLTDGKALFGDKVWVIATKKLYILGSDNQWYEM